MASTGGNIKVLLAQEEQEQDQNIVKKKHDPRGWQEKNEHLLDPRNKRYTHHPDNTILYNFPSNLRLSNQLSKPNEASGIRLNSLYSMLATFMGCQLKFCTKYRSYHDLQTKTMEEAPTNCPCNSQRWVCGIIRARIHPEEYPEDCSPMEEYEEQKSKFLGWKRQSRNSSSPDGYKRKRHAIELSNIIQLGICPAITGKVK
ncbi:hypothetical protein E2320_004207, partial [Naja naja]